jgi:hypothetical protein
MTRPHVIIEMAYNGPGVAEVEIEHDGVEFTLEVVEAPRPLPLGRLASFLLGWRIGRRP